MSPDFSLPHCPDNEEILGWLALGLFSALIITPGPPIGGDSHHVTAVRACIGCCLVFIFHVVIRRTVRQINGLIKRNTKKLHQCGEKREVNMVQILKKRGLWPCGTIFQLSFKHVLAR